MLLAAGLGTRMRPLTLSKPKPLIDVLGRPLLDYVVDNARAEGARRFVINAHYLPEQIVAYAERAQADGTLSFSVSHEADQLLDTGGGVKRALPLLSGDPVLVMNTDAFWAGSDKPISRMIQALSAAEADIVLLCAHPRKATGFRRSHDFCLDPVGRVTRDAGAPVIYAGVALMRRSVFEGTPVGPFSLNRLFETALSSESLFGVPLASPWLHVGDPEAVHEAETRLRAMLP